MVKRHRDQRVKDGRINENRLKTAIEKLQEHCHGIKRSGSHSWEGDNASKHRLTETKAQTTNVNNLSNGNTNNPTELSTKTKVVESGVPHIYQQGPTNINLWPPFSVTAFNQFVPPYA